MNWIEDNFRLCAIMAAGISIAIYVAWRHIKGGTEPEDYED